MLGIDRIKFLYSVIMLFGLIIFGVNAQVVIPRDGFPYCEPFTGNTPRPNTIFDGDPLAAILTSGSIHPTNQGALRLTNNDSDQRGYVFVDLPFSSSYGIKTSFEYFSYGPASPGDVGDGISFFLFDGIINASTFEIGGLGGSLGYSPLRYSDGMFTGGYGLRGAFMGIGLDERGNWGNQYEGKLGGFGSPFSYGSGLSPAFFPRYPNSIAIRGPINAADVVRDNGMTGLGTGFPASFPDPPIYNSYPFIDGKILFNDPTDGAPFNSISPSFFLPPAQRFPIGASGRITDCSIDGYRKVFIDLRPDGAGSYTITMDILVTTASGPQVINIFNNVPYPYSAPQNLKVGFAAATGATLRSIHEIRNVTVEVSSIDPILAPNPPNLDELVCFAENLTFDFDVSLPAANQFIRCLQLYPTNPGSPNNSPNPAGNPVVGNCGLSGVCAEKCRPENLAIVVPGVGTFQSVLEILTDINFGTERTRAKILFTPEPGFFGTHTIFYNVIDNYGLTSEPRTVTVTVNPFPKIDNSQAIIGPTCNGQNDGSINNVVIRDLVPGYVFSWADAAGNVIPPVDYSVSENTSGSYIEATVGVTGINLGRYFLTVSNPVTNAICEEVFQFDVIDVRGTPVAVVLDDQQVCFGTPVVFTPELEDPTDANNPAFRWYKDNGKAQAITNGLVEGPISYTIIAPGVLTITGLPQSATPYEFFVEVAADPTQNLCATPAGNLKRVQVLVVPPLFLDATVTDDLCRQTTGQIAVSASGGFGVYEYSLNGGTFQSSNTFSGLLPGTYTIDVSAGTNCIGTITRTINGPANALSITFLDQISPTCGLNNGDLRFQAAGGTPNYTFTIDGVAVIPTLAGGIYTISGLAPSPTYSVQILDSNSCPASFTTPPFSAIPIPTFDATDDVICPGETATLTVDDSQRSNAINLTYSWADGSGNPLANGNGVTYSSNSATGELTVLGLAEQIQPYQFLVTVAGDNLCNATPISASITVNPAPAISSSPDLVNILCFGDNTGSITLIPADATLAADYTYSVDAGSTFQSSPVFSGLVAGSYDFVIQNTATGCESTLDDIVITESAELLLAITNVIQPACGVSNGLLEFTFSGGVSPYLTELFLNGASASIQSTANAISPSIYKDLGPGTYQLRVTDANNCTESLPQVLIDDIGIAISVAPMEDEICQGELATVIPGITTGGSPDLAWFKDIGATVPILNNTVPDSDGLIFTVDPVTLALSVAGLNVGNYTYFLVATGPGYCPNPPFEADITVYEPLAAAVVTTNEICFQAGDGTITINASGADGNYEYSLNSGPFETANTFVGLVPGVYNIDIRSGNGCTLLTSATILGSSAPIAAFGDISRSSCSEANGSIENLQLSGGWGNFTIEWRIGSITGPIVPGDLNGAENLLPETYFAIITDGEGCEFVEDFVVSEQPLPTFSITQSTVCEGEATILTPVNTVSGSSPTEIRWYKDAAKTLLIQNGPDAADPSIAYVIDDANGRLTISGLAGNMNPYNFYFHVVCGDQTETAIALVNPIPSPVFVQEPVQCFGADDGKIRVDSGGSSSFQYQISGIGTYTEAALANETFAPISYTIKVINTITNCEEDFVVEVLGPSQALEVDPLIKVDPACGADIGIIRTEITGGWAPYEVTVYKDGVVSNTQMINGPTFELNNLAPADYYLTVEDAEGCIVTSNTVAMTYGPTQVNVSDVTICEGETAVLTPTLLPAAPGAIYEWFKDSNLTQPIVSSPNPDPSGLIFEISSTGVLSIDELVNQNSPTAYYLRVIGPGVCPGIIGSAQVIINDQPILSVSTIDEVCFGDLGTITLSGAGGNGSYQYSLDGVNFQSSNSFQVAPGAYSAYLKSGGCESDIVSLSVSGSSAPISNSEPTLADPTCNESDGSIAFQVSGGVGTYSIRTVRNGQTISTLNGSSGGFELLNASSGTYSFVITDQAGCVYTLPASIDLENQLTPVVAQDQAICEGETASLVPSTTQTGISPVFNWFMDSAGTQPISSGSNSNITYQIAGNGTLNISGLSGRATSYVYYLGISGPGTCPPPLEPVEVKVSAIPNLRVSNPSIVCDPTETVDLTQFIEGFNSGIYDYIIESPIGNLMRLDEIETVNLSGEYRVQSSLKGANCWSPNRRIQVIISDEELVAAFDYEADLGGGNIIVNAEVQILEFVNFIDSSLGKVIIWNWDFGDGGTSAEQAPDHIYEKKGLYTVTLTTIDVFGCISEFQRVIQVSDDYIIIVPTAFTPSGAKNIYFKPQYRGIAGMEFYIFSTWGELIFEAKTLETLGWDGTFKGKEALNGNYVYKAVFTTRSGEKVEKAGVFVLIR